MSNNIKSFYDFVGTVIDKTISPHAGSTRYIDILEAADKTRIQLYSEEAPSLLRKGEPVALKFSQKAVETKIGYNIDHIKEIMLLGKSALKEEERTPAKQMMFGKP